MPAMPAEKPNDPDFEMAVLGSLMIDPVMSAQVRQFLSSEDFFIIKNGWIYEAILDLGDQADLITVANWLSRRKLLDEAGGEAYLASLTGDLPTALNVEHYASVVADLALRRRLIRAAEAIARMGFDTAQPTEDICDLSMSCVEQAVSRGYGENDVFSLSDGADELMDQLERQQAGGTVGGYCCGIDRLDELTGGLEKGDMTVVSGCPGAGKTSLVTQMLYEAAKRYGAGSILFSLEMTKKKMLERFASLISGIAYKRISRGDLTSDEWGKVIRALAEMKGLPISIVDTNQMTVPGMIARVLREKRKRSVEIVAVDQLQLVSSVERQKDKRLEIVEVTRSLHMAPKRMGGVSLIAVSQLSRSGYSGSEPTLKDLKESGSIESDADKVIFLYAPDEESPKEVTAIVAKNRNGETGKANLYFDKAVSRFDIPKYEKLEDLVYGPPVNYFGGNGNGNGNGGVH